MATISVLGKAAFQTEMKIRKAVEELHGNLLEFYPRYCYVESGVHAPKKIKFSARGRKTVIFVRHSAGVSKNVLVFTRERVYPDLLLQACTYPHLVTGVVVYNVE